MVLTTRGSGQDDSPDGLGWPQDGLWHHVVAVYDRTTNVKTIYLDGAVLVHPAVLHPGDTLGQLGGHPQQSGQDQPERRPGTTQRDDHRHAGDIADAYVLP